MKPIHKYNNGNGAMLCNGCRAIISTGPKTEEVLCEKCKKYSCSWCNKNFHTEEQLDEFVIEFLEFIEGTYSFGNIVGKWYLHANTSKEYTAKELLYKFKKQKRN